MPILEELAFMPDRFEALFREVPAQRRQWRSPAWDAQGEQFSAVGHACHLRDIETDGYHVRFDRTLKEDCPDLPSLDGHRLARERNYAADDPEKAMAAFRAARAETVKKLRALAPQDWERKATFAEYGEVTLRGLARLLVGHDLQHLSSMQGLLAQAPR